jgi:ectoine hydroxylase
MGYHLTDAEAAQADRDGFVVREGVFDRTELDEMIRASEDLVFGLVESKQGRRFSVGSYTFEPDALNHVMLKWEGDTDQLHGIEPFVHLSPPLERWALDPRLVDPMAHFVGDPAPALFTEKLNLKRPHVGGPNPLHQDYPYWVDSAGDATRVATAIVYLDDTTLANGCLEVSPGSHVLGQLPNRTDADAFGAFEMDPVANAALPRVALEVPAGTVVLFGAFLAHATGPNHTDRSRRALLYSYQPAGLPHSLEGFKRLFGPARSAAD